MRPKSTISGQIEGLIKRLQGVAICDDCITDRLSLSVRSQANVVTRSMGGQDGFLRDKGPCGFCDAVKTVIHHKAS